MNHYLLAKEQHKSRKQPGILQDYSIKKFLNNNMLVVCLYRVHCRLRSMKLRYFQKTQTENRLLATS